MLVMKYYLYCHRINVTQLSELTKTGSAAENFCAKRPIDAFRYGQILLSVDNTKYQ